MNIQSNMRYTSKPSSQSECLRRLQRLTNEFLDWHNALPPDIRHRWSKQGTPVSLSKQMDDLWDRAGKWFFTHRQNDRISRKVFEAQRTIVYATFFSGASKGIHKNGVNELPI